MNLHWMTFGLFEAFILETGCAVQNGTSLTPKAENSRRQRLNVSAVFSHALSTHIATILRLQLKL